MRKIAIIALVLLMMISFGLFAVACSNDEPSKNPTVTITGFELEDEISVTQNSVVYIELPLVLNEADEALRVIYEVLDSKNEYVSADNGNFVAEDPFGYSIRYVVLSNGEIVASKTVKVTVLGSALKISAEYEDTVTVGEEITINASYPEGATVSYEVIFDKGQTVKVVDGKFTPEEIGVYEVRITANKDGLTGYYSYRIQARNRSLPGEVERFDESWTARQQDTTITRDANWKQVSSSDATLKYGANAGSKLKDRFGEESGFLSFEATKVTEDDPAHRFIWLNLDIVNELSYYKQLVDEGYEYMSIWVYIDGVKKHVNTIMGSPGQGTSVDVLYGDQPSETLESNSVLYPGQWTEIKVGLYPGALGRDVGTTSLITSYWNWKANNRFLLIDNSSENLPNSSDNPNDYGVDVSGMTVYIADIFVVKNADDEVVNYADGETVNVGKILNPNGKIYGNSGISYEVYKDGTKVMPNNLPLGSHDLEVRVLRDGDFEQMRYMHLDLLDTRVPMALQEVSADVSKAQVVSYSERKANQLSVATAPGKTGDYYKVEYTAVGTDGNHNYAPGLKINPAMSKAALKEYAGGYIYFEVYTGAQYNRIDYLCTRPDGNGFKGTVRGLTKDGWVAVYMPVNDLLDQYDNVVNNFNIDKQHTGVFIRLSKQNTNDAGYFYVSQFLVVKNLTPISISGEQKLFDCSASSTAKHSVRDEVLFSGGVPQGANLEYYLDGNLLNGKQAIISDLNHNDKHVYSVYINHSDLGMKQLVYSQTLSVMDLSLSYDFGASVTNAYAAGGEYSAYDGDGDKPTYWVETPDGKTGNYYVTNSVGTPYGTEGNVHPYSGLKLATNMPSVLMSAYEDGYLLVEYKIDVSGVANWEGDTAKIGFICDNGNTNCVYYDTQTVNEWHTFKISMKEVIKLYSNPDVLNNLNNQSHIGKLFHVSNMLGAKIYLGNLTIVSGQKNETGVDAGQTWEW